MVSRRLIRIKTFQILYSQFAKKEIDFHSSYKELQKSISKTKDLYFLMLRLLIDIKDYNFEKIENNRKKHLATADDLLPKSAFVENRLIKQFENNLQYQRYQTNNTLNWINHPEVVEKAYKSLAQSDEFISYLNQDTITYKDDKRIINYIFEVIIGDSDEIIEILEEQSIYWTEDFEYVINSILKTIRTYKEKDSDDLILSELYKNDDDKQFGFDLLKYVLQNHNTHLDIIEKHTKNWEIERINQIDILLMEMALAELINMPTIPIKVSLDEYIELSKFYSSAKSKLFINGVLDKVIVDLMETGQIEKKGRGLIGKV